MPADSVDRDDVTLGTKIIDGFHSDPNTNLIKGESTVFSAGLTPDYNYKTDWKLISTVLRRVHQLEIDRKINIEYKTQKCWDLYHSDFSAIDCRKEDWQSQKAFPIFFMTVERFAANFSKLREQNANWFEATAMIPQQQVFLNLVKKWVQFQLEHPDVGFAGEERDLLRNGLISAQCPMMVTYDLDDTEIVSGDEVGEDPEEANISDLFRPFSANLSGGSNPFPDSSKFPFIPGPTFPRLHLKAMDPGKLWLDTCSGRDQYKIWETELSIGDFLEEAERRGYDIDACKRAAKLGIPSRVTDTVTASQQNLGQDQTRLNKSKVLLTHFEGTLTDPDTGIIYVDKQYMVMCNDKEIVKQPVPIPFWDKKSAIVCCPFIKVPNAVYGKSPMTENIDAFESRHSLLNLIMDFFNKSLSSAYECEIDRLHPSEEGVLGPIFPGRVINTVNNGVSGDRPVVRPVCNADLPQGFWQFLQFFQTTFSEFTGMTQELMGMPRTRGRVTGMEFQSRQGQSGDLIIDWFKGLEANFYQPLLHCILLRSMQYTPTEFWRTWVLASISDIIPKNADPKIAQAWKEALMDCANWSPKERVQRLGGVFRFRVKIFSSLMERQTVIEQSTYFIQTVAKVPNLIASVRLPKILLKITTAFGWDPEEVLNLDVSPTPEAEFELLKQMTERGQKELDSTGFSIPDVSGGMASIFGMDLSTFGQEGVDDSGKIDTESGSPFTGTGAPRNVSANFLGG
jgi:hypothetical protein